MTHDDRYAGVGEDSHHIDLPGGIPSDDVVPPLEDPQDFEDYWSEELVILYHSLIDRSAGSGWRLFEHLDFCDFCKFAYTHSSRHKEPWHS